jgi:hypothetical protein
MKNPFIICLLPLLALTHGCADAEFASNNAQAVRQTIKPPPTDPSTDQVPGNPETGDQPGTSTDGGNKTACVRDTTPKEFDFTIPHHKDTVSGKKNPMPQSDVAWSAVQKFNVSEIAGDILPVKSFGLDDVAFIVKEADQFAANGRNIEIPEHALIIKDGNNVEGASGRIDAQGSTVYRYKGQQVTIGTNSQSLASALNQISAMGIQPINHNQIKISDMRAKGFVDASGNVAFKVVHVAHGFGHLKMIYTLQPCK